MRDSNTCADCNPKASQEPGADPTAHVAPQGLSRATSEAFLPFSPFFVLAPLPLPLSLGCLQCRRCLGWWCVRVTPALLQASWRRVFGIRAGRAAAVLPVRKSACVERAFFVVASGRVSVCASVCGAV